MGHLIVLVAALLVLPAGLVDSAAAQDADPRPDPVGAAASSLFDAVLPDRRGEIAAATEGRLPVYSIEATLTRGGTGGTGTAPSAILTGRLELRYPNGAGRELAELYFRLYPNAEWYAEGGIGVRDVMVDGAPVTPEPGVDATVLRVPLPAPIPAGGTADVAMAFTAAVPTQPGDALDLFGLDPASGTYALAYWYPLLAGYDPGTGWYADPLSPSGDPVVADAALYDVGLTVPQELVVVTSGHELAADGEGGRVRRRYVTGPARDFTIVADDDFASASRDVGGTAVTSYYNPGQAEGGAAVLEFGAEALAVYNELFGPYPYAELDLVAVTLPNYAGFEFSQLVAIAGGSYDAPAAQYPPGSLEFIVAHEVAHQWWYNVVGSNQRTHPFLDEGLTNYSAVVYFERRHGPAAARQQLDLQVTISLAHRIAATGDGVVDRPVAAFADGSYVDMVYRKGALGFRALRAEVGDGAFFAGLRDYAARMRFAIATPDDLRRALERAAKRDLAGPWRSWFEAADLRADVAVEPVPEAEG